MTTRRWALLAAVTLALAGCQTLTEPTAPGDPAFLATLNKTKGDATPLFAALQQSSGCTAAANAAAFSAVEGDITQLRAQASVPNNDFSQRSVAGLQSGFADFKRGVEAGGERCSPPTIVAAYQTRFNKTVDDLAEFEQRKGPR